MKLEIHPLLRFSESPRLAVSNSIFTPNFDKIAQSTAVTIDRQVN